MESVFRHDGHFQGEQLVVLTRTLQGEQKGRDADATLATSPAEQLAPARPTVTFCAAGAVRMLRGQRVKPELPA